MKPVLTTVDDSLLLSTIQHYSQSGGSIIWFAYHIPDSVSGYDAHRKAARAGISAVAGNYPLDIDYAMLDSSGKKITAKLFMGPYFEWSTRRPIRRGSSDYRYYFYYDTEEKPEYRVVFNRDFFEGYGQAKGLTQGFLHTFMEPVYTPVFCRAPFTLRQTGEYFLNFCNVLFSNLDSIEVYEWSVDCSSFFDAGKEWNGPHFWTIYNPEKNWYLVALVSTTD